MVTSKSGAGEGSTGETGALVPVDLSASTVAEAPPSISEQMAAIPVREISPTVQAPVVEMPDIPLAGPINVREIVERLRAERADGSA